MNNIFQYFVNDTLYLKIKEFKTSKFAFIEWKNILVYELKLKKLNEEFCSIPYDDVLSTSRQGYQNDGAKSNSNDMKKPNFSLSIQIPNEFRSLSNFTLVLFINPSIFLIIFIYKYCCLTIFWIDENTVSFYH